MGVPIAAKLPCPAPYLAGGRYANGRFLLGRPARTADRNRGYLPRKIGDTPRAPSTKITAMWGPRRENPRGAHRSRMVCHPRCETRCLAFPEPPNSRSGSGGADAGGKGFPGPLRSGTADGATARRIHGGLAEVPLATARRGGVVPLLGQRSGAAANGGRQYKWGAAKESQRNCVRLKGRGS